MTNEPTNADRAEWAREALIVFTRRTFRGQHPDSMDRTDLECAIGDLITDLLHLAMRHEFDTETLARRARGMFEEEVIMEDLS